MTNAMSDTKRRIFDESIRLVCDSNFESVSMRDIAEAVGIKAASIYNHFLSKQEILETYYGYYEQHVFDTRLPLVEMNRIIEYEDPETIVDGLAAYNRVFEDESNYMFRLAKIIYERRICDDKAAVLYLGVFHNNITYIHEALSHGIRIGRIRNFPAMGYAHSFVCQLTCQMVNSFMYAGDMGVELADQQQIRQWMCGALPLIEGA